MNDQERARRMLHAGMSKPAIAAVLDVTDAQVQDLVEGDETEVIGTAGGGALDFAALFDQTGNYEAPTNVLTPDNDTVTNMVYALVTVASGGNAGIDVGTTTVGFTDGIDGQHMLSAEVPPGEDYTVYRTGVGSTIDNVIEIPRV